MGNPTNMAFGYNTGDIAGQDGSLEALQREIQQIKLGSVRDTLNPLRQEVEQIRLGSPHQKEPMIPVGVLAEPKAIIEGVLLKMQAPIDGDKNYKLAKENLTYLELCYPKLAGELKARCAVAVKMLRRRIDEYEQGNLSQFIAGVSDFLKKSIENEKDLVDAISYLQRLSKAREGLVGAWAKTVDKYIADLQEQITDYKKRNLRVSLAAPNNIPEWLAGFTSIPLFYRKWCQDHNIPYAAPIHPITSKYGQVEVVQEGVEYLLGFEDIDEEMQVKGYPHGPDWDYDEPVVRVIRDGNELTVKIEQYNGDGISKLMYFDQEVFDPIGGWFSQNVGSSKTMNIPAEYTPIEGPVVTPIPDIPASVPVTIPPPMQPPVSLPTEESKLLKALPWLVTAGAVIAGGVAVAAKKK